MIKVRIYLESERLGKSSKPSFRAIIRQLYNSGGIKAFYRGIDSAIARQLFYGTARLGTYKAIYNSY